MQRSLVSYSDLAGSAGRGESRRLGAVTLAAFALFAGLAAFVLATDARLGYDDATYLARGLYHAEQVSVRGDWALVRLPWSLRFEAPRPPAFQGLLALAVLCFGREQLGAILVAGTMVPFAALLVAVILAARAAVPRAEPWAMGFVIALPLALDLGTRLFVETLLAAAVLFGIVALQRRVEGGGIGSEIAFGVASGVAVLTKILAPIFLAPAALVALWEVARGEGYRRVIRLSVVSSASATLVAGLWYERNLVSAIEFGRSASRHWASWYLRPWWRRPLEFIVEGPGIALGIALVLLAATAWRTSAPAPPALVRLRRLVAAAALPAAAVVASRPAFEVRYWLPALAAIAAWAGAEVTLLARSLGRPARRALAAGLLLLVALSLAHLAAQPRTGTPWAATLALEELATDSASPPRVCNLGNSPEWNSAKLRLFAELSEVRPRLEVYDPLESFGPPLRPASLERCDVVFALPPEAIPPLPSQLRMNQGLSDARHALASSSALVRGEDLEPALGTGDRVEIWQRRAGLATGGQDPPMPAGEG